MYRPNIRRRSDGSLVLTYSNEGKDIFGSRRPRFPSKHPDTVEQEAKKRVQQQGGDATDPRQVLAESTIQFGHFQGKTFKWLCENALSYAGWIVDDSRNERELPNCSNLTANKICLRSYLELFPEGREMVELKKKEREIQVAQSVSQLQAPGALLPRPPRTSSPGVTSRETARLTSLVNQPDVSPRALQAKVKRILSPGKSTFAPYVPKSPTSDKRHVDKSDESDDSLDDVAIVSCVEKIEADPVAASPMTTQTKKLAPTKSISTPPRARPPAKRKDRKPMTEQPKKTTETTSQLQSEEKFKPEQSYSDSVSIMSPPQHQCPLFDGWRQTLPEVDHQWVSKALFRVTKSNKVELDMSRCNRLWFYPPPPPEVPAQTPCPDRYFASRLLLWMPRRLWQVRLYCPHSNCHKEELISSGTYQRVRQVLDIDGFYNMAGEYLQCPSCRRKVISWKARVVQQLDLGHRLQFPVLMTHRLACDIRVITMLRHRGLGNSSTQLYHKLEEQHSQEHLRKLALYLTECEGFTSSSLVVKPTFQMPPEKRTLPKPQWLLTVYCQDVMLRLDEVKASITSTFGTILKMDSTKKMTKKLACHSLGTAAWVTNVGNEQGQVLNSVLTASEGQGLTNLARGLVRRYAQAGVPPPLVLYVDRDCCGQSSTKQLFGDWPDLIIRLDIWHFMRYFSAGCTNDAHPLYGTFMTRLSQAIFRWRSQDLEHLKQAKRAELTCMDIEGVSDFTVEEHISKEELASHCRRQTRGMDETTARIENLLKTFDSDQGCDTTGVPLFNSSRMWEIWESQRRHVACIQDLEGQQLYTRTGTKVKGGVPLPVYRCARGSSSLESFHLHLNQFIPRSSASDMHFQAYLLEGLVRWNEDRARAALDVMSSIEDLRSYNSLLRHATNRLSESVFGTKVSPTFVEPQAFTGELIGVEYLYNQTGRVLQNIKEESGSESSDNEDLSCEEKMGDEDEDTDEGFEENTVFTLRTEHPRLKQTPNQAEDACSPQKLLRLPQEKTFDVMEKDLSVSDSIPTLGFVRRQLNYSSDRSSTVTSVSLSSLPSSTAEEESHSSKSCSSPTSETTTSDNQDESYGPDGIRGYSAVEALAEYLESLKTQMTSLTKGQASVLVVLWKGLHPYDKRPTTFTSHHRSRAVGRLKASKKQVAPGVQSTKRCFLGQNTRPAQWPDCNRYVEATIVRLCDAFPSPTEQQGSSCTRWTLIMQAYMRIRDKVLNNPQVMSETNIQLMEINVTTLSQWFERRAKKKDRSVLEQGLQCDKTSVEAQSQPVPIPPAMIRPTTPINVPVSEQHLFQLSPNTAGQSPIYKKREETEVRVCKSEMVEASTPVKDSPPVPAPLPVQVQLPVHVQLPVQVQLQIPLPLQVIGTLPVPMPTPKQPWAQLVFQPAPLQMPLLPVPARPLPDPAQGLQFPRIQPGVSQQLPVSSAPIMASSTKSYYKRRQQEVDKGRVVRRYVRKKEVHCRKCGKVRDSDTHKQFYGNWFCPLTAKMTFDEWKQDMKSRGYSSKKSK